jgi:hypothetical protein
MLFLHLHFPHFLFLNVGAKPSARPSRWPGSEECGSSGSLVQGGQAQAALRLAVAREGGSGTLLRGAGKSYRR